jgi:hypothetical protein
MQMRLPTLEINHVHSTREEYPAGLRPYLDEVVRLHSLTHDTGACAVISAAFWGTVLVVLAMLHSPWAKELVVWGWSEKFPLFLGVAALWLAGVSSLIDFMAFRPIRMKATRGLTSLLKSSEAYRAAMRELEKFDPKMAKAINDTAA